MNFLAAILSGSGGFNAPPQVVRLVLDSNDGDYAAVIAALNIISSQDAAHDATIKLVTANGPIVRTGDLAPIAYANFATGVYLDEFVDEQDFSERGYHLLGLHSLSATPELTSGLVYIKHGNEGDTGGDGKTPGTAKTWEDLSFTVPNNTGIFRGGCIYFHQAGTASLGTQGVISFTDGSNGDEIHIRDDHPLWPGVQCQGWLHTSTGVAGEGTWTQDGSNPVWSQDDWAGTYTDSGPIFMFGGDFPILGTSTEWHDNWILEEVASLALCRSTESSYFLDGAQIYIHPFDGASPATAGRKILHNDFGLKFNARQAVSAFAPTIRFINTQNFDHGWVGGVTSGDASNYAPNKVYFEGGRFIFENEKKWFIRGASAEKLWKASTLGRILWDTSDRRNTPDSEGVLQCKQPNNTWATNAASDAWNDYKRHPEIGYATVGPHPSGAALTAQLSDGFPTAFNGSDVYLHNIGNSTKGLSRDTADCHMIAIRGQHTGSPTWQRVYGYNVANGFYWYRPSTAEGDAPVGGATSSIYTWAIDDLILDTWNGVTPSAGIFAVNNGGDNDAIPQDDGTGLFDGLARRVVMIDFRPTGSLLGTPSQESEGKMFGSIGPGAQSLDCACIRSNWALRDDRSGHTQSLSSVHVNEDGVGFTDITSDVLITSGGGAAAFPSPNNANDQIIIGRKQGPVRRLTLTFDTVGAGGAALSFGYWNGSTVAALSVTDGTSAFTQNGTITFTKPSDWVANTVNSVDAYHVYITISSGSFSTIPVIGTLGGVQTGFFLYGRRWIIIEPEEGIFWTRSGTYASGAHTVDLDDFEIILKGGQSISTQDLFRIGSGSNIYTLSEFQALSKLAEDTDADQDSVFIPTAA